MTNALINLFEDNEGKFLTMHDIYELYPKYYNLSNSQLKKHPKYQYPLYQHELRSMVTQLVKKGLVKRPEVNSYIFNKK